MNDSSAAFRMENHHRGLRELVREILDELKEFANTRFQVLKSELKQAADSMKAAVPLVLSALLLGVTSFWLLTVALVAIVSRAFAPSSYAWFLGLVIIGVIYLLGAAMLALIGYKQLRHRLHFPERTVEVLRLDKAWIQSEASHVRSRA